MKRALTNGRPAKRQDVMKLAKITDEIIGLV